MASSSHIHYGLHFRPVGQGLFSHGWVVASPDEGPTKEFQWVYDCGSQNVAAHLLPQIGIYEQDHGTQLDLLMLSHFDGDHVIGVERLLRRRKPAVIVAPYLALDDRLARLAFLSPGDTELASALLFPGQFLRANAGDDARIVFILPGGGPIGETGAADVTNPDQPWPPGGPRRRKFDFNPNGPAGDPDLDGGQIITVEGNKPYVIYGAWEFCFYNQPRPEMMPAVKPLLVSAYQRFQQTPREPRDYWNLIVDLRHSFADSRGPALETFDANEISLVVYSGPVSRDRAQVSRLPVPALYPANPPFEGIAWPRFHWTPAFGTNCGCGSLFTGDLTLCDSNFAEITVHFGPFRLDFVSNFQVPHHGSRHSYKLTSASHFVPDAAFISSARYHAGYDHPNAEIVEALRRSGPIFVNEFQGAFTYGVVQL